MAIPGNLFYAPQTPNTKSDMRETVIKLSGVSLTRENRVILSDIDLTVRKGDFLAITGPNGGGKTTLLRIILKLIHPSSGKVDYYSGATLTDHLPIGYLPQKNTIDSRFPISVKEVVESGLLGSGKFSAEERAARTNEILELVEMESFADSPIGNLSGGQLQRTLLGRALISRPGILVLDEPLSYIDKRFEKRMYDIFSSLAHSTTIILVSHEMSVIAGMASRHLIVDRTIHECCSSRHFTPSQCE